MIQLLPWPRLAEDGKTPLGVDLALPVSACDPRREPRPGDPPAASEVGKLVAASLRGKALPLDPDDVAQEVALAIVRRNHHESAYDPRRAGFAHYVWQVAGNVVGHLMDARKRFRRERAVDEAPEVPDERDPVGAFEDVEGLPVEWLRANAPKGELVEEPLADESGVQVRMAVQLDLFGGTGT